MKQSDEQQLAKTAKHLLDSSNDKISLRVSMRLQQARAEAIKAARLQTSTQLSTGNITFELPNWLSIFSITAVFTGVILLATLLWMKPISAPQQEVPVYADLPLLGSSEEIDMYQDLEFYLWISDEQTNP